MKPNRFALPIALIAGVLVFWAEPSLADALERMALDRLKRTDEAVRLLQNDRRPVEVSSGYNDYRAVVHVHSHLSHDSHGTVEEIRRAAREVGVQVVLFTEHPADHYDYYKDGHRGLVDGVLFVPGAEQGGLLNFPMRSLQRERIQSPQQRVDLVTGGKGGLAFLSHLEVDDRMEWELDGLTGTEIYNTHADFKDEARLARALRNPASLLQLIPTIKKYPQGTFASLLDYPADYLARWDELCRTRRLTGVAANDSHHNQGMRAVLDESGMVRLEDALGEMLATLDPEKIPALKVLLIGKSAGDTVFHVDLDPYERSFRHASTHLLMHELSEPAVREALAAGRAYVAFDWLCDPTGFVFQAVRRDEKHAMGSEIPLADGLQLVAAAPLAGTFRLMHGGREVAGTRGRILQHTVDEPGAYRVEVWLNLPDEPRIWILSNPIYIRGE